ncbi:MAG TPA: SDR family NAD(P)-dependent oxidoreductase [Acidimicrobiales bacterium]
MDELRFDDRTVIVTGAGRGLGRSHALLFAARGARVVVNDLGGAVDGTGASPEPADAVVAEILSAGGDAVASYDSVADPDGAASIVRAALETFGGLDVVVNNAGISDVDSFDRLSTERWQRMVDVHLFGTVHVLQAAWPVMVEAGYGRVVNTFSEGGLGRIPKATSYGSAKGGVLGFTRTLASEGANLGISVNAISPRADTRSSAPEILAQIFDLPAETFAGVMKAMKPELVSPAAVFLAHESCTLNGEVLVVGEGQVCRMAIVENEGITRAALTPEDIAANLAKVMDVAGAHVVSINNLLETV